MPRARSAGSRCAPGVLCGFFRGRPRMKPLRTVRAERAPRAAVSAVLGALALAAVLPAQGAILDVLDGETLYDGGFLFSLGQEWQRRERLRSGSDHVADPQARHELERSTTMGLQYGLRHDLQLGIAVSWQHTDSVAVGQ